MRSVGRLLAGNVVLTCSLGRNGLTWAKREGDGMTPRGDFALRSGFIRRDRLSPPMNRLGLRPSRADLGWSDDSAAANYNRPLRLPTAERHEALMRADALYDVVIVLDYNIRPRIRSRGSAIFFHLVEGQGNPTQGCVAISRADMRRLLPRLSRKVRMIIR